LILVLVNASTKAIKVYSLELICVLGWGIGSIFMGMKLNEADILQITKISFPFAILIPVFFLHVVFLATKGRGLFILYFAYMQAFVYTLLILRGDLFASTKILFNSITYPQGNTIFLSSFVLWIINVSIAHYKLAQYYKIANDREKTQIKILFLGIPIGFGGGLFNFLPALGINTYPSGNFFISIYFIIATYAILKRQFLDIELVIKKGVIYSTLITLISLLYLLTVFLLEKFAQEIFGYRSLVISICTAFGLGSIFVPLRHRIQQFVDRYFFKGTQQEIVQQNEQLRQEVAQSDKYKTLFTLASGVAHEIKNPLTSIKTFCEYLPRKLDDKAFLLKFSDLVGREVDRIDGMVHELLDYSKPAPLALKKIDVNKLIQDTLNTLNSQFIKNRIDVVVTKPHGHTSPAKTPLLDIDANRIKQALLNVLLNAVEAMPKGGRLTVSSFVDRTSHIVTIADTGSGIPPEDLKHIFDPFFSRKDNGTGLGLAIVQGIVEQHKGKIKIESKVGIGTTVVLEFPLEHEN